jgi:pimeloyl-ACP methyl ester carboxylesterase
MHAHAMVPALARRTGRKRRTATRLTLSAVLLATAVLTAGCGSRGTAVPSAVPGTASATAPATIPATMPGSATAKGVQPTSLPAFYTVPRALPAAPHGTLIKSEQIAAPGLHGTVYRVMYLSASVTGAAVPVTGVVMVPDRRPGPGGYPVVTWGHGSSGLADTCAPSLDPATDVPLANNLLDQGWEITASDGQGSGTPGLAPYLVGTSAARNVIDIVRAARQLPAARAGSRYVVWGHSEGGQTALFTAKVAASYAPELRLEGAVAGAPPSQFHAMFQELQASPYHHYLFMTVAGFNAAYGDRAAPVGQVLTPFGVSELPVLNQVCDVATAIDRYPSGSLFKVQDPFTIPAWASLLTANDPGAFTAPSPVPTLIIQGGNDQEVPVATSQLLTAHLCGIGQDVERWIYPGQSHTGVFAPSAPDMVRWIADRFAGTQNPDPYIPHGQPGIQITRCPAANR